MVDLRRGLKSLHNRAELLGDRLRGTMLRITRGPIMTSAAGLMVGHNVDVQIYGRLQLGQNVRIAAGCLISVGPDAELEIGDGCYIGRNTVIVATTSIRIGDHVDIAEHCTIRDSDHDLTPEGRRAGLSIREPVAIGPGCWVGAGVRVLRGSHLGPGVLAAANAVVRGSFEERTVIAGVPARVIRKLDDGREIYPRAT